MPRRPRRATSRPTRRSTTRSAGPCTWAAWRPAPSCRSRRWPACSKVSRERVRKALHRLVHEGWLDRRAQPRHLRALAHGRRDARDLRRALDARGGDRPPPQRRARHRGRAAPQGACRRGDGGGHGSDDRGRLFGLSGEFHILLAELCGNERADASCCARLLTRSTMHFSLSAPERFHNCAGPHDHGDIVEAILARQGGQGAQADARPSGGPRRLAIGVAAAADPGGARGQRFRGISAKRQCLTCRL